MMRSKSHMVYYNKIRQIVNEFLIIIVMSVFIDSADVLHNLCKII